MHQQVIWPQGDALPAYACCCSIITFMRDTSSLGVCALTAPHTAPAPRLRGLPPLPRRSGGDGERLVHAVFCSAGAARPPLPPRCVCCMRELRQRC